RRAGGSAQEKYDELTRSWRRRNRARFAIVGIICGAILAASFVASLVWSPGAWIFGVFGGGALTFYCVARWGPPCWIEHWQEGVFGEKATAKALKPLEREGWIVLHDLQAGRGNVDHIAIGP